MINIFAYGADGTIWFGNPDGSPMIFRTGSEETIPVWVQTNSDVYIAAVHIPLATNDRYITQRQAVILFQPFTNNDVPKGYDPGWDAISGLNPKPIEKKEGFTNQSILGFMDLAGKRNLPLHCEEKCKVAEFTVTTVADDSLKGNAYDVMTEGLQVPNGGLHFSDTLGVRTFIFDVVFSKIYFVFPGDINDDHQINEQDIAELQDHLTKAKEIPWPDERADLNNDSEINNDDLVYLESMIKK